MRDRRGSGATALALLLLLLVGQACARHVPVVAAHRRHEGVPHSKHSLLRGGATAMERDLEVKPLFDPLNVTPTQAGLVILGAFVGSLGGATSGGSSVASSGGDPDMGDEKGYMFAGAAGGALVALSFDGSDAENTELDNTERMRRAGRGLKQGAIVGALAGAFGSLLTGSSAKDGPSGSSCSSSPSSSGGDDDQPEGVMANVQDSPTANDRTGVVRASANMPVLHNALAGAMGGALVAYFEPEILTFAATVGGGAFLAASTVKEKAPGLLKDAQEHIEDAREAAQEKMEVVSESMVQRGKELINKQLPPKGDNDGSGEDVRGEGDGEGDGAARAKAQEPADVVQSLRSAMNGLLKNAGTAVSVSGIAEMSEKLPTNELAGVVETAKQLPGKAAANFLAMATNFAPKEGGVAELMLVTSSLNGAEVPAFFSLAKTLKPSQIAELGSLATTLTSGGSVDEEKLRALAADVNPETINRFVALAESNPQVVSKLATLGGANVSPEHISLVAKSVKPQDVQKLLKKVQEGATGPELEAEIAKMIPAEVMDRLRNSHPPRS